MIISLDTTWLYAETTRDIAIGGRYQFLKDAPGVP